jgi:hypothetical protein
MPAPSLLADCIPFMNKAEQAAFPSDLAGWKACLQAGLPAPQ